MGRAPCCEKVGLKRGRWTAEEDEKLVAYIKAHGEGSWRSLPKNAGLLRCGKSCRLRWINYLRDDIKRGNISIEEEETIMKLHSSLGNKWSLIASHLTGRTDNEIKNYWNSHLSRKISNSAKIDTVDGEAVAERKSKSRKTITAKNNGGKSKAKKKSSKKKQQQKAISESPPAASSSSPSAQSAGETDSMVLDPDPHQIRRSSDLESEPQFWSSNDELDLDCDHLFVVSEDNGTLSSNEGRESVNGGVMSSNEEETKTEVNPNPNPSGSVDMKEAEVGGGDAITATLTEEEALSMEMEGTSEFDMEGFDDVWTWLCDNNTENIELGKQQGFGDCSTDYQTQMDSIASWLLSDAF